MQLLSCQCDAILGCGGNILPKIYGKGNCCAYLYFLFLKIKTLKIISIIERFKEKMQTMNV